MQFIPRYLVKNRTNIIANDVGFITEYRPVYSRQLQVYKGIDNVLEFRILNADQKPINVGSFTPKFQAFDENKNLIIEHDGLVLENDDSSLSRGLFSVTITDNDLLNVKQQYLSYNIHLVDNISSTPSITYSDSHFGNSGIIYVSAEAFPGPRDTQSVTQFTEVTEDSSYWVSESIDAQPGINGNEALHTAVIYSSGYTGNVTIQATLDNQITGTTAWSDIVEVSLDGSETELTPVNFNGVFSFLRFKTSASPADTISKILVRN